jgi:hypothetical protein
MTANRKEIEKLLMRIQSEFLNTPSLRLTVKQVQGRCTGDLVLCQALLNVLVDARVIAKSPEGTYARYFPVVATNALTHNAA